MIKKLQLLVLIILISSTGLAQVGIGTTSPDASAALDVSATDKGFLMPRMTTVQRTAIVSPATSLTVFDTDTNTFWSYVLGTWIEAKPGGGKFIDGATPDIAYYPTKVGIGINTFGDPHMLFVSGIKDTDGVNTAARINGTYDGSGTSLGTTGLAAIARNNGTGTSTWGIGVQAIVENPNAGGTITNASATYDQIQNDGIITWGVGNVTEVFNEDSGTITEALGEVLNVYNRAGASIGEVTLSSMYMENTGNVTGDGYGLWIGGSSTGTVAGDAYALYISTPFENVSGNNFALYSDNTSDSYIEGSLGVGVSAPQQKVHISGAMRLEPQATAPSGGALGDLYAGTDGNLYFYDGTGWKAVQLVP